MSKSTEELRREVDIIIGNPLGRKRDTDVIMQLFDQELAKRVEEARIDGHVEALKAVLSSAQPNSNVVVTGLVSFMLQGAREKRASLNNQTKEEK